MTARWSDTYTCGWPSAQLEPLRSLMGVVSTKILPSAARSGSHAHLSDGDFMLTLLYSTHLQSAARIHKTEIHLEVPYKLAACRFERVNGI